MGERSLGDFVVRDEILRFIGAKKFRECWGYLKSIGGWSYLLKVMEESISIDCKLLTVWRIGQSSQPLKNWRRLKPRFPSLN